MGDRYAVQSVRSSSRLSPVSFVSSSRDRRYGLIPLLLAGGIAPIFPTADFRPTLSHTGVIGEWRAK
jgi:hypothetical protein